MSEQRGLKALEVWSRRVTDGHKDVAITDLTHSWRNGLGFCAIIHHYRPDLIDYDALSKENIFQNNATAFSVAEKQLGIPALLDAEDMVKYEEPDRLSVATYLSELYRYFEGGGANAAKREPDIFGIKKSNSDFAISSPSKLFSISSAQTVSSKQNNVCHVCKNRVFILERLIVDNKLYHRTCFACHKCHSLLQPGAYVEAGDDMPGLYECATCPKDETRKPLTITEILDSEGSDRSPFRLSPCSTPSSLSPDITHKRLMAPSSLFVKDQPKQKDTHPSESSPSSSSQSSRSSSLSSLDKLETYEDAESTLDHGTTLESNLNFTTLDNQSDQVMDKSLAFEENETSLSYNNSEAMTQMAENKEATPSEENESLKNDEQESFATKIIKPSRPPLPLKPEFLVAKSRFGNFEKPQNLKAEENDAGSTSEVPQEVSLQKTKENTDMENILSDKKSNASEIDENSGSAKFNETMPFRPPRSKSTLKRLSLDHGELESQKQTELSQSDLALTIEASPSLKSPKPFKKTDIPIIISSTYQISPEIGKIKTDMMLKNKENQDITLKLSKSSKELNDILHSKWSRQASPRPASMTESFSPLEDKLRSLRLTSSSSTPSFRKEESPTIKEAFSKEEPKVSPNKMISKEKDEENMSQEKVEAAEIKNNEIQQVSELKDISKLETSLEVNELKPITSDEMPNKKVEPSVSYPDDLNPFKDEDDSYPDELNPFGDDNEEEEIRLTSTPKLPAKVIANDYDDNLNPFGEDDGVVETSSPTKPQSTSQSMTSPQSPSKSYKSPTGSLRSNNSTASSTPQGTLKKRRAPLPPSMKKEGDKAPATKSQSPQLASKRPPKPPPSPPKVSTAPGSLSKQSESDSVQSDVTKESALKKKKRPAPPVPIPPRREIKKIPLKDIQKEMAEIELKQQELEKQGRELELRIRDKPKDGEPSAEDDEQIVKLFEMVNQKNILFRRQAELMYIKRYQRLEEEQAELEFQLRCLMSKASKLKTEEEKEKEEELLKKLLDIVDQRNEVVDSIDLDRKREAQEEIILEQVEYKKAELKAKSKESRKKEKKKEKKIKKNKEKKEKKEKEKKDKDASPSKTKKKWLHKVI